MGAGANRPFVYRLKYGRAETVAMAIMALYTGNIGMLMGLAQQMNSGMVAAGMGYNGMAPAAAMGLRRHGIWRRVRATAAGWATAAMAAVAWATGRYGLRRRGLRRHGLRRVWRHDNSHRRDGGVPATSPPGASARGHCGRRAISRAPIWARGAEEGSARMPHVVPNPFDNTLIIQGTPEDVEQIKDLLRQLDVAPRQVLIDAKIYEVDLTGAFSAGLQAYLDKKDTSGVSTGRTLTAIAGSAGLTFREAASFQPQP